MNINWAAVSAIIAALTMLGGLWIAFRGGHRTIVSFKQSEVRGEFAGASKLSGYYGDQVGARRTTLKNRGRHLDNISIRLDFSHALSYEISKTSSIDKKSVKLEFIKDNGITVSIPDFPANELIEIDIIFGGYASMYGEPIGGSSKFRLMSNDDFLSRRSTILGWSFALTILIFLFAPSFFARF